MSTWHLWPIRRSVSIREPERSATWEIAVPARLASQPRHLPLRSPVSTAEAFRALLASSPSEQRIQLFLEANPQLFLDLFLSPSTKVVKQFPVAGGEFRADFGFVHTNSGGNHLTLLEFESPSRRIFNRDDGFSQHFNHALQQVRDWVAWCRNYPEAVRTLLRPMLGYLKSDNVYASGLLVMGHRSELTNRRRQDRFEARASEWVGCSVRTYDGFVESLADSEKWRAHRRRVPLFAHRRGRFVEVTKE